MERSLFGQGSLVLTVPSTPGSRRTIPTGVLPSTHQDELDHGHPPVSLSVPLSPNSRSDWGGGAHILEGRAGDAGACGEVLGMFSNFTM